MKHGICWENQKGKRAPLHRRQSGGWYGCLLLFAGAVLSMYAAYKQLMDAYPLLQNLELPGIYFVYVLLAAAVLSVLCVSKRPAARWARLFSLLPAGWCFYRYYAAHRLPLEDGSLYVARGYMREFCRFFKISILFPNGLREEAPRAILFWSLLLLCGLFILASVFQMYLLLLLPPVGVLAAHIAVGRSPEWDSMLLLLTAGIVLAAHWAAMPDRWYVRTAQLAGVLCVCIITGLVCGSVSLRVVDLHEGVQRRQYALEDAALALPVWGFFEQHGTVDNHKPGGKGREVLRVWLSGEPTENIYLKSFAASRYENGQWTQDAASFADAALREGLSASEAGGMLLSEWYGTGKDILSNREEIDFLNSGGWSMAQPRQHGYRVTCRDFGTRAPLPYVSALPDSLSMEGDVAPRRPWNMRSYGGSLMMGGGKNDSVAEYLEMYYLAKNFMWYTISASSTFQGVPAGQERDWYSAVVREQCCQRSDNPVIADFLYEHAQGQNDFEDVRSYMDSLWDSGWTAAMNYMRLVEAWNVQQWMQHFGAYSQSLDPLPEGADAIDYFLGTSERGYCVHYASAATLMLQTIGIPARYASGYVAFPSDFEKEKDGDGYTARVTDVRAHAWVEIYLEDFGWLPVEVTPGFAAGDTAEPEKKPEDESGETEEPRDEADAQAEPEKKPEETQDTPQETSGESPAPQPQGTAEGMKKELRLFLGYLAGAGAVLLVLYTVIRMLRERERRCEERILGLLRSGRHTEAVNRMNRRIHRLLRRRRPGSVIRDDEGYRDALEKLEAAGDADAYIRLVKQAYFSNAQLSAEDAFACYELYGIYRDALRRRKARK